MIQTDVINDIANEITKINLDGATVGKLRLLWPDIHFTHCSEDDISQAKPVLENSSFSLYLVDNSNHCISFTLSNEKATGIVIAECEDEE